MIREAIKKEMKSRGDYPAKLARECKIHQPTLHNYFNNKATLSYKVLEKILAHYDLVLVKKY